MQEAWIAIGGAVVVGFSGWVVTALYSRLVGLLDDTAKELAGVARVVERIEAGHGARLDALERG